MADDWIPTRTSKIPSKAESPAPYLPPDPIDLIGVSSWVQGSPRKHLTPADIVQGKKRSAASEEARRVEQIIARSKHILTLEADWDENDAQPVLQSVWQLAIDFAQNVSLWANRYNTYCLGDFSISPLNSGGIDLYWQNPFADLLVTVSPTGALGSCYGQNLKGEIFRGAVDLRESFPELVITWLKRRRG